MMKQKSNAFVVVVLVAGLACSSFVANNLYNWKSDIAPYEVQAPTQFYAGMDKFLSNISWMTLVQWRADDSTGMSTDHAELLYKKLNALTNLDPLFGDAYLDGALSLAPSKPDLALKLLDKAISMGLDKNWKVPFYAGQITLAHGGADKYKVAEHYYEMAAQMPDAADYVQTSLISTRCLEIGEPPVESMRIWYTYLNGLHDDQQWERKLAAGHVRDYAESATTDIDTRLQSASDASARDAIQRDRTWMTDTMKEVEAKYPLNATTQPTTAPAM